MCAGGRAPLKVVDEPADRDDVPRSRAALTRFVSIVVLGFALGVHRADADGTIYACANGLTGRVRTIVTSPPTCRTTETPLSWNQVGPPGPVGPAGATGPQGPQGATGPTLVVRDSNGALVGVVAVVEGARTWVARQLSGMWSSLLVGDTGFVSTPSNLDFTSNDCSGQPYLPQSTTGVAGLGLINPALVVRGTSAWLLAGPPVTLTVKSLDFVDTQQDCTAMQGTFIQPNTCSEVFSSPSGAGPFLPVTAFDLSTLGLVPPFHVDGL